MTVSSVEERPLVVLDPDAWDYLELTRSANTNNHPIVFYHDKEVAEDIGAMKEFDPLAYLERLYEKMRVIRPSGVVATDDYPGSLLANICAKHLGLPNTPPAVALLFQHKFLSREKQRECVPEAVPSFWLIPRRAREIRAQAKRWKFPFFVKPVKSAFQLYADVVRDTGELVKLRRKARSHVEEFTRPFDALFAAYAGVVGPSAATLLAEDLLTGQPFTVEGFVYNGQTTILGVVDAYYYRGTRSYQRFQYPSMLDTSVQERVAAIVAKLMTHVGYQHGPFNIDCLYNRRTDRIFILEINPRMAPQIADLFEKVDGTNSYRVLVALARGRKPKTTYRKGPYRSAASFVLRKFADKSVTSINGPESVLQRFPDARIHIYAEAGTNLSDDEFQDIRSYVYAIINLGGDNEKDLWRRLRECETLLAPVFRSV
jgi:hypothetical protein